MCTPNIDCIARPKKNVGFPLLVLLGEKPKAVDWDKKEVMMLCGYSDRLQSSRRIPMDRCVYVRTTVNV